MSWAHFIKGKEQEGKRAKKETAKIFNFLWEYTLISTQETHELPSLLEKAEVLHVVFTSVFTSKASLGSQVPETRGKWWSKEDVPSVEEDKVMEYLSKLDIRRSVSLLRCTHEGWESWCMSSQGHFPCSLNNHGNWERCLRTGRRQIAHLSSKRARRKTQGTTCQSALPESFSRL